MNRIKKLFIIQEKIKKLSSEEERLIEQINKEGVTSFRNYRYIKCEANQEVVDAKKFFNILKDKKVTSTTFKGKDPLKIILDLAVISKRRAYAYVSDEEMKQIEKKVSTNLYRVEKI